MKRSSESVAVKPRHRRRTLWRDCLPALLVVAIGVVGIMIAPDRAHAETWTQPYGGCKEGWQAPQSKAADDCRDHGWTINSRVVLNPHAVVRYLNLPHCRYEDGSRVTPRCVWLGHEDGNRRGLSMWYGTQHPMRPHYFWSPSPTIWRGLVWVNSALSDALAESGVRHAARDWTRCAVHYGPTTTVVCPDGQVVKS